MTRKELRKAYQLEKAKNDTSLMLAIQAAERSAKRVSQENLKQFMINNEKNFQQENNKNDCENEKFSSVRYQYPGENSGFETLQKIMNIFEK